VIQPKNGVGETAGESIGVGPGMSEQGSGQKEREE
jgi:hypothetical protein